MATAEGLPKTKINELLQTLEHNIENAIQDLSHVPAPDAEPDGKMLLTEGGALVYGDAPDTNMLDLYGTRQATPGALLHEFDLSNGLPPELVVQPGHANQAQMIATVVPYPTGIGGNEPDPAPATAIQFTPHDPGAQYPTTYGATWEYQAGAPVVLSAWVEDDTTWNVYAQVTSPPGGAQEMVSADSYKDAAVGEWHRVDIALVAGERVVFYGSSHLARVAVHEPVGSAPMGAVSYQRVLGSAVSNGTVASSAPLMVSTVDDNPLPPSPNRPGWKVLTHPFDPSWSPARTTYSNPSTGSKVTVSNNDTLVTYAPGSTPTTRTLTLTASDTSASSRRVAIRVGRNVTVNVTANAMNYVSCWYDDGLTQTNVGVGATGKFEFTLTPGLWEVIGSSFGWRVVRVDAPPRDTGTRDVASLVTNTTQFYTDWGHSLNLRRIGNVVYLDGLLWHKERTGMNSILNPGVSIPTGFRPAAYQMQVPATTTSDAVRNPSALATGAGALQGMKSNGNDPWPDGGGWGFSLIYPTSDPWPSTLPGAPV